MSNNDNKKIDLLVTHKYCADGLCSWFLFAESSHKYDIASVMHYKHDADNVQRLEKTVQDWRHKNIIFCDVMPTFDILQGLSLRDNNIVILDHHKLDNATAIINMTNVKLYHNPRYAACEIVWRYLYNNTDYPLYVKYIADRDTWRFKMPNSRIISNILYFYKLTTTYTGLKELSTYTADDYKRLLETGIVLADAKRDIVASFAKMYMITNDIYGNSVALSEGPYRFRSDIADIILSKPYKIDYVAIYRYNFRKKEWHVALRSRGDFDTTAISVKHGGGGHKNASKFIITDLSAVFKG